jgi:hypothetical protein
MRISRRGYDAERGDDASWTITSPDMVWIPGSVCTREGKELATEAEWEFAAL